MNINALQMSLPKIEGTLVIIQKKTTDLVSCLQKTCVLSRETNTVNFFLFLLFLFIYLLFLVFSVVILHRKLPKLPLLCFVTVENKNRDSKYFSDGRTWGVKITLWVPPFSNPPNHKPFRRSITQKNIYIHI